MQRASTKKTSTRYPNIPISQYPSISGGTSPDIPISQYPNIIISGYRGIGISGFSDILGYRDIGISGYWDRSPHVFIGLYRAYKGLFERSHFPSVSLTLSGFTHPSRIDPPLQNLPTPSEFTHAFRINLRGRPPTWKITVLQVQSHILKGSLPTPSEFTQHLQNLPNLSGCSWKITVLQAEM